jgi:hypothetical protein
MPRRRPHRQSESEARPRARALSTEILAATAGDDALHHEEAHGSRIGVKTLPAQAAAASISSCRRRCPRTDGIAPRETGRFDQNGRLYYILRSRRLAARQETRPQS